jgi:hypothetical protein
MLIDVQGERKCGIVEEILNDDKSQCQPINQALKRGFRKVQVDFETEEERDVVVQES